MHTHLLKQTKRCSEIDTRCHAFILAQFNTNTDATAFLKIDKTRGSEEFIRTYIHIVNEHKVLIYTYIYKIKGLVYTHTHPSLPLTHTNTHCTEQHND